METIAVGGTPVSILLIKNPAGANEVLRTLRLEAGDGTGLDLWIALNDRIADGRDVSWVWDADFELLAGAARAGRLRRDAGAGDGGAAQVRRDRARSAIEVEPVDRALARPRASPSADGPLFALPTYTALIELRTLLADARPGAGVLAVSDRRRTREAIWHDVECGAYARRPGALGRARRPRPAARCSSSAPGPGGSRCDLAARGHRVVALDSDPELCSTSSPSARRPPGLEVETVCADARELELGRALRRDPRADAARPPARRRRRARRACSRRRAATSRPAGVRRRAARRRRRGRPREAGRRCSPTSASATAGSTRACRSRSSRRRRRDRGPAPAPDRLARTAS